MLRKMTLNARSIRDYSKRKNIFELIDSECDFAIITETWLHPKRSIIQSPFLPYRGVAIVTNQEKCKLVPVFPSLWTDNLIMGRLHRHDVEK